MCSAAVEQPVPPPDAEHFPEPIALHCPLPDPSSPMEQPPPPLAEQMVPLAMLEQTPCSWTEHCSPPVLTLQVDTCDEVLQVPKSRTLA